MRLTANSVYPLTRILEVRYGTGAEEETAVARIDGGSGVAYNHLDNKYGIPPGAHGH